MRFQSVLKPRLANPYPFLLSSAKAPIYRTPRTGNFVSTTTTTRRMATTISLSHIKTLQEYSACDISDALLKLKVPNCGYLPDLHLYSPSSSSSSPSDSTPLIAPASTVLFAPKTGASSSSSSSSSENVPLPEPNIPSDQHYVDLTEPGSIVVISQPQDQICACLGGIMALRMSVRGARGVVAWGRVRDVEELRETGLSIWARGTSITGTGAEAVPHALQVPLNLSGTIVRPGDLVFGDPINGVVVIPVEKVAEVVEMLPKLVSADERVKEDVKGGMTVKEAFKKHRG